MKRWPDDNDRAIKRHLQQLRLRHCDVPAIYRSLFRGFQEAVARHESIPSRVSRRTLEAWLRDRAAHWTLNTFLHRAGITDRFLDFLVEDGSIESNPIAELRRAYCIKDSATILRALIAPDSDGALQAARQLPPFGSVLGELMRNHITMMRTRGYRFETQERIFLRVDRFLQTHPELADETVPVMLQRWASARTTAQHAADCARLARTLFKARYHLDPSVPLVRPDPRPAQQVARQWRRPHIYSPQDIRLLLDMARSYPSPCAPLRPITLYTAVTLGYCAGLRLGEIARLNLGDIDWRAGSIAIMETKFYKSRILPVAGSVVDALREYSEARRQAGAPQDRESAFLWHDQGGTRYSTQGLSLPLVDILRRAGLKPPQGKTGPRIHDLRHSMVVNRILAWYRAGINPQERLPFLATYLGHRDIHSTLVYITVTQELLQEAGERFRIFGARCLQSPEGVQS